MQTLCWNLGRWWQVGVHIHWTWFKCVRHVWKPTRSKRITPNNWETVAAWFLKCILMIQMIGHTVWCMRNQVFVVRLLCHCYVIFVLTDMQCQGCAHSGRQQPLLWKNDHHYKLTDHWPVLKYVSAWTKMLSLASHFNHSRHKIKCLQGTVEHRY